MAARSKPSEKADIYQEITDKIIAAMEKGTLPWQKAWDGKAGAVLVAAPINGKTKHPYTKENLIYLSLIMQEKGDGKDPRFYTWNQAKEMGFSIKKGAKSTVIKQGFYATKDRMGNPLPEDECHWTATYSRVFHASDLIWRVPVLDENQSPVMEDLLDAQGKPIRGENGEPLQRPVFAERPIPPYVPTGHIYTHEETMELAEQMLVRSGANICYDQADRAFYRSATDEIHLPPKEAFKELASFYATALHELGHWTGHKSRLNRELGNAFGTTKYAKEELRAEMASAYLSADVGLPLDTMNHAAYTQNWIQALKNDKMEFVHACNDAKRIADYIKKLVHDRMKEMVQQEGKENARPTEKEKEIQAAEKAEDVIAIPAYKYYLNQRPADIESVPKDFMRIDADDRGGTYGAIYYDRELSSEEIKTYELTADDYYRSQSTAIVTVYKGKEDGVREDFNNCRKPVDFQAYSRVYQDQLSSTDGVTKILDSIYAKIKQEASLQIGDVIGINDRLFHINAQGFQEVAITRVKNRQILTSVTGQYIKRQQELCKELYGAAQYALYQKKFRKCFVEGAMKKDSPIPTYGKSLAESYSDFIYLRSLPDSLSSLRPNDQMAWKTVDKDFIAHAYKNALCNPSALPRAAKVVQENSPYAALAQDAHYASSLMNEYKKSPEYKTLSKEYREVYQGVSRR